MFLAGAYYNIIETVRNRKLEDITLEGLVQETSDYGRSKITAATFPGPLFVTFLILISRYCERKHQKGITDASQKVSRDSIRLVGSYLIDFFDHTTYSRLFLFLY